MPRGTPVVNQVVWLAVTARDAAMPALANFTKFGGDIRQGMIAFGAPIEDAIEPKPGNSLDEESERSGRKSGVVTVEGRDNSVLGALFWGERRGYSLWYRWAPEGEGTGNPYEESHSVFESIGLAPDGSGFQNWSVTAQIDTEPTEGVL